jgi:hypothetical protein
MPGFPILLVSCHAQSKETSDAQIHSDRRNGSGIRNRPGGREP